MPQRLAIIINPISGAGRRPDVARRRAALASAFLHARGLDGEVFVTERQGHAHDLARGALARGVTVCVAWGGDGTVNEVASALTFTKAALAIVPSGSGNGLARELAIPQHPNAALDIAASGCDRIIDAGDVNGRRFFNLAGIGLDARVAHRFAIEGVARRGFLRYLQIAATEIFNRSEQECTIVTGDEQRCLRPLIIAIANGRQYGNGALIAPRAKLDDGLLDLVVVDDRSPLAVLRHAPRLFQGRLADVPGVTMASLRAVEISSESPIAYHLDGEPGVVDRSLYARVLPAALHVRVRNLPAGPSAP